jgi:Family of unknown function (DUF6247)
MSSAAAEPIRTAAGLDLPDDLPGILDALPGRIRGQFDRDLLRALVEARRINDLAPVQAELRRGRLLAKAFASGQMDRARAWVEAGMPGGEPLTYEQACERFGLQPQG